MTLYQYNSLDELEQSEALCSFGIELGTRKDGTYLYTLYSLYDFYVETKRYIEFEILYGLRTFKTSTLLEPYLENIDISQINPSS